MGCTLSKHVWLDLSWSIIYPSLLAMFIKGSNCFGWVLNQLSVCLYIAYIWECNRYSAVYKWKQTYGHSCLYITQSLRDLTSEGRANPIIDIANWCVNVIYFLLHSFVFCFTPVLFLIFCPSVGLGIKNWFHFRTGYKFPRTGDSIFRVCLTIPVFAF